MYLDKNGNFSLEKGRERERERKKKKFGVIFCLSLSGTKRS
jgi:hypothetical protein